MRLNLPAYCFQCKEDQGKILELTDVGFYQFKCSNGHTTDFILQEQLFEVLFELGVSAICDGYYREAVSNFTASLERFYEYYIELISYKNKVDKTEYDKAWKSVKNQSERQLGAFSFCYLIEKKKFPTLLDSNTVGFRNNVIHKGKIPSKEEAINYGQAVIDVMTPILRDLEDNYKEEVSESIFRYMNGVREKHGQHSGLMSITTVISNIQTCSDPISLKNELEIFC